MRVARCIALIALAGFAGTAMAQEQFQIFGLPLGAKIPYAIKSCARNAKASSVACWLVQPSVDQNKKQSGRVMLPDDKSPAWVGLGESKLTIDSRGILESVTVGRLPMSQESLISSSIERRFGGPSDSGRYPNGNFTQWAKAEVVIQLICPTKLAICDIEFLAGAEFRRREAEKEAKAVQRLLKPQSP
jgi:hypothetical protein